MSHVVDDREPVPAVAGMVSLDERRVVTACDVAFQRSFHCADADLIGRPLEDLVDLGPASVVDARPPFDMLGAVRIGVEAKLARLRLQHRDGGYALHAEPIRDHHNLLYRAAAIAASWAAVFRDSRDGVAIVDPHGRVLEHNAAFRELLDLDAVDLRDHAIASQIEPRVPRLASFLRDQSGNLSLQVNVGATTWEIKAGVILAGMPLGAWIHIRDVGRELAAEAQERDLARARLLQRALFSRAPAIPQCATEIVYRPLQHIGGDAYDITVLPDRVRMFVADATGHGVSAALVAMVAKSAYDAIKHEPLEPSAVLAALNDRVARNMRGVDGMFTATVVDIKLASRTLVHAVAGHPPPLLADGDAIQQLEFGGSVLGVAPGRRFPMWSRTFAPGMAVYLITDGIEEARNASGEQFGMDRLNHVLAAAQSSPANSCKALLASLDEWARPAGIEDDITIIGLRDQSPR